MFGFRKKETITLAAPMSGTVIPLSEVKDAVFSQRLIGDGAALIPDDGTVTAPLDAVVQQIAATKHAIGLIAKGDVEILIHIGLDTVNLKGAGFEPKVAAGQPVTAGQVLMQVDLQHLQASGYDLCTPCVITNPAKVTQLTVCRTGKIQRGEPLLTWQVP